MSTLKEHKCKCCGPCHGGDGFVQDCLGCKTGNVHNSQYRCKDCGTPLNDGEGSVFTVCSPCWDKVHPPEVTPADATWETALKLAQTIEGLAVGESFEVERYADVWTVQYRTQRGVFTGRSYDSATEAFELAVAEAAGQAARIPEAQRSDE